MYGSVYAFTPRTFILPNEFSNFVDEFTKSVRKSQNDTKIWICKPSDLSRGRKIFLIKELS